jgi:hypothetical protein
MATLFHLVPLWFVLATAGGCMHHSRNVTPWLRTSRDERLELFAESGHTQPGPKVRVERKEPDGWRLLPEQSDRTLAFADETRVVVDNRLYREQGPPVALGCDGELRATPDGNQLVCVRVFDRLAKDGPPQTVRIVYLDADGREVGRHQVAAPVTVPADEPPFGRAVAMHLLGFLPQGLVFSLLVSSPKDSFETDAPKEARAFLLNTGGQWSELGALRFPAGDLWKLRFPRPWNETLGWHVAEGERLRDTRGQPNP